MKYSLNLFQNPRDFIVRVLSLLKCSVMNCDQDEFLTMKYFLKKNANLSSNSTQQIYLKALVLQISFLEMFWNRCNNSRR